MDTRRRAHDFVLSKILQVFQCLGATIVHADLPRFAQPDIGFVYEGYHYGVDIKTTGNKLESIELDSVIKVREDAKIPLSSQELFGLVRKKLEEMQNSRSPKTPGPNHHHKRVSHGPFCLCGCP
jgi:hypothetical protein